MIDITNDNFIPFLEWLHRVKQLDAMGIIRVVEKPNHYDKLYQRFLEENQEIKMKAKFKYLCIGFIMGFTFYACDDAFLQADEDDYGAIGTVEWNPLYVYITNE